MADVAVAPQRGVDRDAVRRWLRDNGVYVAVGLLVAYNLAFTSNFATTANLNTQLVQMAPVLIVALGMALVIGTEGIDLSVGSVMAIAVALLPLYLGYGLVVGVVMALLVGALAGLLNGSLVAIVGIQPIVATLALLVAGRGIALVIAGGQAKDIDNETLLTFGSDRLLGVPLVVWLTAVLCLLVWLVVRYSTYGRRLVAIGGNRRAAGLAGLPVRRTLMTTYVLSGVLAAVAGIVVAARLTASNPSTTGQLIELRAITAVVVGGTPLSGGRVRIVGTIAGALLIQLIRATLIRNDLPDSVAQIVQAVIIIVAVYAARETRGSS